MLAKTTTYFLFSAEILRFSIAERATFESTPQQPQKHS